MRLPKSDRKFVPPWILAVAVIVFLACGPTATGKLQEAASTKTPRAAADKPTKGSAASEDTAATSTPRPTPTAKVATRVVPVQVVTQGFGQDEQELGYAFVVENPNAGLSFENASYQIAAYNEDGTVLATDSGYVELILPGQTLGIAGTMWLDEGQIVSKLDVQWLAGDSTPSDPVPTFAAETTMYHAGDYWNTATGLISSPYDIDLEDISVSAVAYDAAGEIIGGGYAYLDFVLAHSSRGVDISVVASGEVASVELFASVSWMTVWSSSDEVPDGADEAALLQQGYGQQDAEVSFAMLIANPNTDFAIESTQYHVTAFAADGRVLGAEEGYLKVLLPDQTLGVAGTMYLLDETEVARIDAQILTGDFVATDPLPHFTAENMTYAPADYFSQVTGEIANPYDTTVTDIRVSAVLYDEAGTIIGGGYTYLDFVPANGKTAVEVSVTSSGTPATIELYAALSGLSEFE